MQVVIDRSKWLYGEGDGLMHRESDGKTCAIGHFALACGLQLHDIIGKRTPKDLAVVPKEMEYLLTDDRTDLSPAGVALFHANDAIHSTEFSLLEREVKVASLLGEQGITILFIGG